jgi:hypothetical protein
MRRREFITVFVGADAITFFLSSVDARPPYGFMLLPGTTASGFAAL